MTNRRTAGSITWEAIALAYFELTACPKERLFFNSYKPTLAQLRFRYWMWRTAACAIHDEPLPPLRKPEEP